ncbi:MAG: hypothetical protein RJQ14_01535 [Marinoscillum sp.]
MITFYSVLDKNIQRHIALDVSNNLRMAINRFPELDELIRILEQCDVELYCEDEYYELVKNEKLMEATKLIVAKI